ncbi:bifunctional 2-polyprenyl-6-hydroxyphenol methylase/3-demethylubiquinol 3-O-methyltransferase UbiG [uncultured Roseobacter sp.]|uniref:class I SAM-dependent methyltransferase n=1 Tax=uncultured Roseobacter sp. TaxID=114847 RepID=UPI00261362F5|nr:class I SAM-dependent methyltransferase [uncultured Roseobacter sp.]
MTMPQAHEDASAFWEGHYAKLTAPASGRPSAILVRFTAGLVIGRALDLGCACGDDTIWLARQGWTATGVDVAQSAIDAAQRAAEHAGVAERTRFARHDLNVSIPDGAFDLVSAMFLHSPGKFDRLAALQRAANVVAPGGLLLIAAHGSRAPWSWADPDTVYPTADEELVDLSLTPSGWHDVFVGPIERIAYGPGGQTATVIDTVIALERLT